MKIKGSYIGIFFVAFLAVLASGCSKKEDKTASKDKAESGMVVANVGNRNITALDFERYFSTRTSPFRRQLSREDLDKRLDRLILEEVLYQEALRLKLDEDPEMHARIRQMFTQKLMDQQINQKEWNREITEGELQEHYDRHFEEFNRPAQVRLADILIAVPDGATAEERAVLRKKVHKILDEAMAVKEKRAGLRRLISRYSDTPEKYRKGDTGFFDIEGSPAGVDKSLAEAAFQLERIGSMAEHVIETPEGYHVVMLIGKRSAVKRPLDAVRNQIEQQMRRQAVTKARQGYIESIKKKAEIEIDTQVVATVLDKLNKKSVTKKPLSPQRAMPPSRRSAAPPPFPGEQE